MSDQDWRKHLEQYPVGVCAICPRCGGSSMSNCACAKAKWQEQHLQWRNAVENYTRNETVQEGRHKFCTECGQAVTSRFCGECGASTLK